MTYLTGKEARARLGVSKKTLLKYLALGLFPKAYRLPSRKRPGDWRIPEEDVEAFKRAADH